MKDPAYQDVPAAAIPIIDLSEAQDRSLQCKVLVGSCGGTDAVIVTDTPVQYLDFRCKRGAAFTHPVPPEMETVILYVYHGKGVFNGEPASDGQTILFSAEGETVGFECTEALSEDGDRGGGYTEDLRFLLLCGKKLREPIARHGPFVMNTRGRVDSGVYGLPERRAVQEERDDEIVQREGGRRRCRRKVV